MIPSDNKHQKNLAWLAGIFLMMGVFVSGGTVQAATDVEIYDVNITTDYDNSNNAYNSKIYIRWYSDVLTTGTVEYGTESGVYTKQAAALLGLYHFVYIPSLPSGTTYYLRITSTAPDGGSTSVEKSIVAKARPVIPALTISDVHVAVAGPTELFLEYAVNRSEILNAAYGTSAELMPNPATCSEDPNVHTCRITKLQPATTYSIQLNGLSRTVYSDIITATTSGIPTITSITPTSGKKKTKLTINGTDLRSPGNTKKPTTLRVAIGCKLIDATKKPCYATGKVLSWNNTKIVYRVGKWMTTGAVYVGRYYRGIIVYTAKGPTFTIR